jgi:hypothetical protein
MVDERELHGRSLQQVMPYILWQPASLRSSQPMVMCMASAPSIRLVVHWSQVIGECDIPPPLARRSASRCTPGDAQRSRFLTLRVCLEFPNAAIFAIFAFAGSLVLVISR